MHAGQVSGLFQNLAKNPLVFPPWYLALIETTFRSIAGFVEARHSKLVESNHQEH
jgi:hypothetical protein